MGGPAPHHTGGTELSLAHRSRRGCAALRMAATILELPAQAFEDTSVLDGPSSARPSYRALSLAKSKTVCGRACTSSNFPRSPDLCVRAHRRAKTDRQCCPLCAG